METVALILNLCGTTIFVGCVLYGKFSWLLATGLMVNWIQYYRLKRG